MRVALISLSETFDHGDTVPIGMRRVGGRSVARFQLDLALELGCERIICLSEGMVDGLAAFQHVAEKAGARFHVVRGTRQLAALITAADEVLVIEDGLVPAQGRAIEAIGDRPKILLLPAEPALAAGFERVDATHGWAGIALLRGSTVERLSELPSDSDPVSALLRIGLQAGTRQELLPPAVLSEGDWLLLRSESQLAELEQRQLARLLEPAPWTAPGLALVDRLVRKLAGRATQAEINPLMLTGTGALLAVIAIACAAYDLVAAGFFVLALAVLVLRAGESLAQLLERFPWSGVAGTAAIDGALLVVSALELRPEPFWPGLFPVLAALGSMRLAGRILPGKAAFLARDRFILSCLAGFAAFSVGIMPLFQVVTLAFLAACLFVFRRTGLIQA